MVMSIEENPPTIAWVTLTNGRKEYFEKSRPSWYQKMHGNIVEEIIVDTSGDPEYLNWLTSNYPSAKVIPLGKTSLSYAKSVKFLLDVCSSIDCDYIFHLEDDYILEKDIVLEDAIDILKENDNIVQVHFIRQPWIQEEIDAGSVLNYCKGFGISMDEKQNSKSSWVEHTCYFTFGPNIYKKDLVFTQWNTDKDPELEFYRVLISNKNKTATFGKLDDPNIVTHIGHYRLGTK
jgi:hypothetical protein